MRLVLDTDVVLSGLRSSVGASRIILMAVEAGRVMPLVSVATILEYEAVLKRADHLAAMRLTGEEVDRFLDALVARAEPVDIRFTHRPTVRDPDDELFMAVAINGRADALVTFNRRDYRAADPAAPAPSVAVLAPGEVLRRLSWRPAATSPSACPPRS